MTSRRGAETPVARRVGTLALAAAAVACGGGEGARSSADAGSPAMAGARLVVQPPRELRGTCDASAVAALDARTIVVANDEDDVLRVYDLEAADGLPVDSLPLAPLLDGAGEAGEADLEGVAQVGDTLWWIGSHANHRTGRDRARRRVLLATVVRRDQDRPRVVLADGAARAYRSLREDLVADTSLAAFGLAAAAARAPEPAGLNVEGLAPGDSGELLVGFRSPLVDGAALLVRLRPARLLVDETARARVVGAATLDLGGLGVRGIERLAGGTYVVAAGPADDDGATRLYEWTPNGGAPRALVVTGLAADMKIEGVAALPGDAGELLLVADDGGRRVEGRDCKEHRSAHPERMRFRVARATLVVPD